MGLVLDHRHSAHAVRVPVEELRGRVDHDVRPQLERALEEGAHERVVHDEQRAAPVRGLGQGRDVADLHERVGGGLDPEQRELARRLVEGARVARVQERELHAVGGQDLREEAMGAAVHVVGDDHALDGLDERHHGVGGRHAGRETVGVGAALEGAEVLFQGAPRGILGAGVFVALVLPDPFLDVRRGLEDRCHDRAGGGIRLLSGMNAIRGYAH